MAAVSITEVTEARQVLSGGQEIRLYTCTATSGGTVDASAIFENIYYSSAEKTTDGTEIEIFTDSAYSNTLTFHTTTGACYLTLRGTSIRSTGGST